MNKLIDICGLIYRGSQIELENLLKNKLLEAKKVFIITANPEIVTLGEKNDQMNKALHNATIVTADGVGIEKTVKWLLKENCYRNRGIDIAEFLLELADMNSYKVFFYGAKMVVLEDLLKKCKEKYKNIQIVGSVDGYTTDKERVKELIMQSYADIVLVALGAPRQECFIDSIFPDVEKGIFIGVGGAFDVLSEHKKRTPRFWVEHNMEWAYRVCKEPTRLKRFWYGNILFFIRAIREKVKIIEKDSYISK